MEKTLVPDPPSPDRCQHGVAHDGSEGDCAACAVLWKQARLEVLPRHLLPIMTTAPLGIDVSSPPLNAESALAHTHDLFVEVLKAAGFPYRSRESGDDGLGGSDGFVIDLDHHGYEIRIEISHGE